MQRHILINNKQIQDDLNNHINNDVDDEQLIINLPDHKLVQSALINGNLIKNIINTNKRYIDLKRKITGIHQNSD